MSFGWPVTRVAAIRMANWRVVSMPAMGQLVRRLQVHRTGMRMPSMGFHQKQLSK
jgi:hypothetical protein